MAYIPWIDDLNTDIPEIDTQHRKLVDYINELDKAVTNKNREAVNHVLEELIDYTVYHFTYEEKVMQDIDYKYFIPHQMTHKIFVKRVSQYKRRFDEGEEIAEELYEILLHWLLQHIKHEDQGYAAEIRHKKEDITKAKKEAHSQGIGLLFKRLFHLD